ncbi:MAG: glycoside hydrolase family 29 [Flammeovirgaceae bacterium]|nr:glycoside hydrolase family 29 [Flammeovirgaceae bacterium]MBE62034.1 glycoside hydrolase family 29 [Flammeovirgaceae bacterium]HCX23159.1 glycoside hydrolase family 29 [Cytophagales bacterium]
MKIKFYPPLLILLILSCEPRKTEAPEPISPVPTKQQLMWHQMELNAFVHFTINTFTDKEWGYGDESPELFNPSNLDAEQWIGVLKDAGFKGVILTTKHHDGFCLWPSAFTDHDISQSPYKGGQGDIVKEVAAACQKYGLKFGIYMSPWDRNRSDYGDSSYVTYYRNQLEELFTNYGEVFEMWFDGANGGDGYYGGANEVRRINRETYYDWPTTLDMVRKLQSDVLFFSDGGPDLRWGGNEQARAGETNWHTITKDTLYAGKAKIEGLLNTGSENGQSWVPLEANTSIRPGWFYHTSEDTLVKSPEQLFEIYLTSVGRGATLLLNIPPDRRGLFHENDVEALKGFRDLLEERFKTNHAMGASIIASSTRGNSDQFGATSVIDEDLNTYWATDDGVHTGSLTIDFGESKEVKYVLIQEFIQLGQRVKAFRLEAEINGQWEIVDEGTTIGYKHISKIDPVKTNKIRFTVLDSKACPVINNLEVY